MSNDSNEYPAEVSQLDARKNAAAGTEREGILVSRRNYLQLASAATASAVAATGIGSASFKGYQYGEGGYGKDEFGGNASDGGESTGEDSTDDASADPVIEHFEVAERYRPSPHAELVIGWQVSDPDEALERVTITVAATDGEPLETKTIDVTGASASGVDEIKRKHGGGESYDVTLVVTDKYDNESSRETRIDV